MVAVALMWFGFIGGIAVLVLAYATESNSWWAAVSEAAALWMGSLLFATFIDNSRIRATRTRVLGVLLIAIVVLSAVMRHS
jgi:hypothetical protein